MKNNIKNDIKIVYQYNVDIWILIKIFLHENIGSKKYTILLVIICHEHNTLRTICMYVINTAEAHFYVIIYKPNTADAEDVSLHPRTVCQTAALQR